MQLGPVATIARLAAVVLRGLKQTQRALKDPILAHSKSQIAGNFAIFPASRMLIVLSNIATIRGTSRHSFLPRLPDESSH